MESIFARRALLEGGWACNVLLGVADGHIQSIDCDQQAGSAPQFGIVVPGLCNAHSHAFQRALAGHTEQRAAARTDTFWTWRAQMYRLAVKMNPDLLQSIATQLYAEMLSVGFTSVVEFHYLLGGQGRNASANDYLEALVEAANDSGIRLVYVPVLYERADFDRPNPSEEQLLFALELDAYLEHCEAARSRLTSPHRVGVGAHSLRAVSLESMRAVDAYSQEHGLPLHIHAAEQLREVDTCQRALGARPVEWLLEHMETDERWTLVHATHLNDAELSGLARSNAVVCLCPSTEANLGDGLFRLRDYLDAGGRVAVGSDSHVTVNPFEELRWLEYGQRLATQQRNIAAVGSPNTGAELYRRVMAGGAQSSAGGSGQLAVGAAADLVAFDDQSPMLAGHDLDTILDALVFSGYSLPVERVLVAGQSHAIGGSHAQKDAIEANFRSAVSHLNLAGVLAA